MSGIIQYAVFGFFHLAFSQHSSKLYPVSVFHLFLLSIVKIDHILVFHQLMEMWAVSIFYLFMNIAAINILVVFFYFEM